MNRYDNAVKRYSDEDQLVDHVEELNSSRQASNQLSSAASLYLRQHAHNPINWYKWGAEAFNIATQENKPIFLSIGYSTCYWCHVMEREVFCDKEIAKVMNQYFVNIKLDREERPDLDELYMVARQLITQEGGWPNNLFLTPDKKPFFAGGTFAKDGSYGKMPFMTLIERIIYNWEHRRAKIIEEADSIHSYINTQLAYRHKSSDMLLDQEVINALISKLRFEFDQEHGGFFAEPKFPNEIYLLFLLKHSNEYGRQMALLTLDKIAAGGIHDHIDGGFHRYAVDAAWSVPHFEKMLYNQALLTECYLEAYNLTKDNYYHHIVCQTLNFVIEYMYGDDGGFYSAIDAETNATEGAYYTWDTGTIDAALTEQEKKIFYSCYSLAPIFQITPYHSVPGHVLYCPDESKIKREYPILGEIQAKLQAIRSARERPITDHKIITSWNCLMVNSFLKAGALLMRSDYINVALDVLGFLCKNAIDEDGRVLRIVSANEEKIYGNLEDYAFLINSLLQAYNLASDSNYLSLALSLLERCNELFQDPARGGYICSAYEDLITVIKDSHDSMIISANAMMVQNMLLFAKITQDKKYLNQAVSDLNGFAREITEQPIGHVSMIHALCDKLILEKEFSYVNLNIASASQQVSVGEIFEVQMQIQIKDECYVYAYDNEVSPMQVEVFGSSNLRTHQIIYPKSLKHDNQHIYRDKIVVRLFLSIERGEVFHFYEDINFVLRWQVCTNDKCLAPGVIKQMISVQPVTS